MSDKTDKKIKLLIAVRNSKPAVATDETEKPVRKPIAKGNMFETATQNATSIKGKVVDDSEIEDGKSLVYNGKKDKIVYARVRHSGGVAGAGTGDMTKVVYDTDADNVVESADNSDTVDGSHAADFEVVANKGAALGYCNLDGSSLVPLNRIPATLTGKDADTVDGVHAAGFLQGTWASGVATVANGGTAAHGLGGTPTRVLLSANAVQPYAMAWTADATNITFHHSAAATLIICWLARL